MNKEIIMYPTEYGYNDKIGLQTHRDEECVQLITRGTYDHIGNEPLFAEVSIFLSREEAIEMFNTFSLEISRLPKIKEDEEVEESND